MPKPGERAIAFKDKVQRKIQALLQEFAEGKLSQAQFDVLYDRYHSQLLLAEYAVESGSNEAVEMAQDVPSTIAVREAAKGKAMGLTIFHKKSGIMLEMLGDFDVPPDILNPLLVGIVPMIESGEDIGRHVERVGARAWLLFTVGHFTVVVTLFHNEPSPMQNKEIGRLHQDFEAANHVLLVGDNVNANQLAYPFVVFVQQRLSE